MSNKIKPIRVQARFIRELIYAEPGSGKTRLAGTSDRAIILNADGKDGTDSAAVAGTTADEWVIGNYKDLNEAKKYLKTSAEAKKKYRWVWLDSATLFQELGMDDIMKALIAEKPHRDRDIPDVAEYLRNQTRLSRWVREMKSAPYHLGITAHVMRIEDEDGEVIYMPAIHGGQGSLSSKICGYMSIVGRLYVKPVKKGEKQEGWPGNILQTYRTGKFYGKDRFNAVGKMYNPTQPKIDAAVKAALATKEKK